MFRKVVSRVVDDLDAVALLVAEADRRLTLILDADNTLVPGARKRSWSAVLITVSIMRGRRPVSFELR